MPILTPRSKKKKRRKISNQRKKEKENFQSKRKQKRREGKFPIKGKREERKFPIKEWEKAKRKERKFPIKDIGQEKKLGIIKLPLNDLEPETVKEFELGLLSSLDTQKVKDKKDRGTITIKV